MALLTYDKLAEMQAARRRQWQPKPPITRNYSDMLEVRTMEQILRADVAAELEEKKHQQAATKKEINRQRAIARQQPKVFLPDLMAEMVAVIPKTEPVEAVADQPPPQIELPKEEVVPESAPKSGKEILKLDIPLKKPEKRIFKDTPRVHIPEKDYSKPFVRPPARYDNISSPYGIWTEMAADQLKKSG